jgi:hypothetical protein
LDAGPGVFPDRYPALDVRPGAFPRRRVFKNSVRIVIREGIQRWMAVREDSKRVIQPRKRLRERSKPVREA